MACKLAFTRLAAADRDAILSYLASRANSPVAASKYLDELERAVRLICDYPELHPLSRDEHLARLGYRSCLVQRYVVLYKMVGETVVVGRIFHGSQDYAKLV